MVIIRRNPDGTIANPDMVKQQTQQQKHKTHNKTNNDVRRPTSFQQKRNNI